MLYINEQSAVVFEPCIWWSLGLGGLLGLHNDRDVATTSSTIGSEQERKMAVGKRLRYLDVKQQLNGARCYTKKAGVNS